MLYDEELAQVAAAEIEFTEDMTVWLPNSSIQVLTIVPVEDAAHARTLCVIGFDFENGIAVQLLIPSAMKLDVLE